MPRRVLTKLIQDAGIPISDMTVRRRLKSLGFEVRCPVKKPKLTETMKKKRLWQWAKQFRNWTKEDWEKVYFSDESSIEILMDKSTFVRRRRGKKYHAYCIVERVKHPLKIIIWSVISSKGIGRLHIGEGTMRQDQYTKVLKTKLLPQIGEWFPNGEEYTYLYV
ncbi:Transposable element Tc1 transposase [Anthophora quadrimaculata]